MCARGQRFAHLVAHHHGADGEPVAERLGQRERVGQHFVMLISKRSSGSTDSSLDLVDQKQEAMFVTQLAKRFQKTSRSRSHATLALNRLYENCGSLRVDRFLDSTQVSVRHVLEPGRKRLKALLILRLAGRGEGRERASVK